MTVAQKAPFEFTVLDNRVLADENFFTDECPALVPHCGIMPGRFQIRGDVALNFFERGPGEFAAVENGGVFGLAEVKQVGWLEPGSRPGETAAAEKRKRNGCGSIWWGELAIRGGRGIFAVGSPP